MSWNTLEFLEVTDVSNKRATKRSDFLVPAWSSYHQVSLAGETENLRYGLSPSTECVIWHWTHINT